MPMSSGAIDSFSFTGGALPEETVVVVGGESDGLSAAAKKFAHAHLGERLFVPLRNGINSLNVASAASVILFHIATVMERQKDGLK